MAIGRGSESDRGSRSGRTPSPGDSPAGAHGVDAPAPIRGLHVLVVGGGGQAARELEATLKTLGLEPQIAATGGKALLDLRRASDNDETFEAVLIHERLPDRQGSDLAVDIRREPRLGAPAVVLIAEDNAEPHANASSNGFALLRRPFDAGELLSALTSGLSRTPTVPVAFDDVYEARFQGRST